MKPQTVLLVILVAASLAGAQPPAGPSGPVEWLYYGGDQGGTKYSPLTDIGPQNVQRLQVAWEWKHWETPPAPGFFEGTPLMIDGVLYVTTPYNNVAAVDAETGTEKWRFDGKAEELGPLLSSSGWKLRGAAGWRGGGRPSLLPDHRYPLFS